MLKRRALWCEYLIKNIEIRLLKPKLRCQNIQSVKIVKFVIVVSVIDLFKKKKKKVSTETI